MKPSTLTLDERDILRLEPGADLPKDTWRAQARLLRAGLIRDRPTYRGKKHTKLVYVLDLTPKGEDMRAQLLAGVFEPDFGWGILHIHDGDDIWWCPDAAGYSADLSQAGLFSERRAREQNGRERAGTGAGRDMAIPPARMLELVTEEITKTQARLDRLHSLQACLTTNLGTFEPI